MWVDPPWQSLSSVMFTPSGHSVSRNQELWFCPRKDQENLSGFLFQGKYVCERAALWNAKDTTRNPGSCLPSAPVTEGTARSPAFMFPGCGGCKRNIQVITLVLTVHNISWYLSIRRMMWAAVFAKSNSSQSECLLLLKKRFGAMTVEMFHILMRFFDSLAMTLLKNVMRA